MSKRKTNKMEPTATNVVNTLWCVAAVNTDDAQGYKLLPSSDNVQKNKRIFDQLFQ